MIVRDEVGFFGFWNDKHRFPGFEGISNLLDRHFRRCVNSQNMISLAKLHAPFWPRRSKATGGWLGRARQAARAVTDSLRLPSNPT